MDIHVPRTEYGIYARYSFHSGETPRRRAVRAHKACHLRMRTERRAGIKYLACYAAPIVYYVLKNVMLLEPAGIWFAFPGKSHTLWPNQNVRIYIYVGTYCSQYYIYNNINIVIINV